MKELSLSNIAYHAMHKTLLTEQRNPVGATSMSMTIMKDIWLWVMYHYLHKATYQSQSFLGGLGHNFREWEICHQAKTEALLSST